MSEHDERIAGLETQVAALRQQVEALTEALHGARERVSLTMREQSRCPGCGGTKLLHSSLVCSALNRDVALCLYAPTKLFGGFAPKGTLELYACIACGLVEWYVSSFEDVPTDDERFRIIEGGTPDASGPYR